MQDLKRYGGRYGLRETVETYRLPGSCLRLLWATAIFFVLLTGQAYAHEPPANVIEDEWVEALIEHQANPPHVHQQFRGLGGVEQWRALVSAYFQPGQVDMALCVIQGESNGDPAADNPSSSAAGLWQFLRGTWDWVADQTGGPSYDTGAPYDPKIATEYAYWLWVRQGWAPWNAARRC